MFGNPLSATLQRPQFIRSVQILLMLGIFWKPTFYPNHRARNPHPGDGLDPLLGPRIFRALRLGPFEDFPDGIARRLARRLRPQSGSHPKAGSLEPAKGSDSSPNAYRKTSIGRGSTSIVHISSEPYNVLISAKNPVVCTQLYRIIQGFHKR